MQGLHAARTAAPLDRAVARAAGRLLDTQRPDGHWVGELQGDTILESEYVLLMAYLGREADQRVRLAANYLRQHQTADGGWACYPGGPADLTVSVKAYFALKIAGDPADEPHMRAAKRVVLDLGGAERSNSFTRLYLALLGQYPFDNCPTVPPELILLPRWFPINVYRMSSWSRTIFVPLSVAAAHRQVRRLPEAMHVRELFREPPEAPRPPADPSPQRLSWTNFFLYVDKWLKRLERWRLTPLRRWALRWAVAWMRERYADSDGVGAIFPPMVYNVIVLRCLGVADDDPEMIWAMRQIEDLMIREGDTLRLQPCLSPVWDTGLSLLALAEAGEAGPAVQDAVDWLLTKEVRRPGDWAKTNPHLEPGGWFFEYNNVFYPDTDDTCVALAALARLGRGDEPAARRGVDWLLGMQNRDGGWAAFDRGADREFLAKVPFADHNAMGDPSCPDITMRVLEGLAEYGFRVGDACVDRAVAFALSRQGANGSWFGRWGVNYIYGTWQVLVGLERVGFDMDAGPVRRAVAWLKDHQQPGGGWGESCRSYDDLSWAGRGPATASQTAWALMGLLAAGEAESDAVKAGVDYLLRAQRPDGTWAEDQFTGTGFPRVFYLRYHMYPLYFPLTALARYRKMRKD